MREFAPMNRQFLVWFQFKIESVKHRITTEYLLDNFKSLFMNYRLSLANHCRIRHFPRPVLADSKHHQQGEHLIQNRDALLTFSTIEA